MQKFVRQLEQLEFAVKEAAAGQKGTLTVGAVSTALLNELPVLLDRLRAAHPDLTVAVKEIDSVDAVPMLNAGDIDIAFARLEGELGPLSARCRWPTTGWRWRCPRITGWPRGRGSSWPPWPKKTS